MAVEARENLEVAGRRVARLTVGPPAAMSTGEDREELGVMIGEGSVPPGVNGVTRQAVRGEPSASVLTLVVALMAGYAVVLVDWSEL
jgi:hypothetical protein